jgi:hypothetical protein
MIRRPIDDAPGCRRHARWFGYSSRQRFGSRKDSDQESLQAA